MLREITRIVKKNYENSWSLPFKLGCSKERSDVFINFFNQLAENTRDSEKEITASIFGDRYNLTALRTFRHRFKERLLNCVFLLDVKDKTLNEDYRAYFKCNKYLQAAKILLANGGTSSSTKLLKKAYKIACKNHFTEEAMIAAKELRHYYSTTGEAKEFNIYNKYFTNALNDFQAESKAEELFNLLSLKYARSTHYKPEDIEMARLFAAEVDTLKKQSNSFYLNIYYFRIRDYEYELGTEYKKALKTCSQAKDYLLKHPELNNKILQGEWTIKQLNCCLHLKDYERGKVYADECMKLFPQTSINRLVFFEYFFLLAMHTGRYLAAERILRQATSHSRFQYLPAINKEKWSLFEAYLYYVRESAEGSKQAILFDVNQFFNEVPVFSKDKKGYNVSILIIQTMFFLARKDFDAIIVRSEALKVYKYRYLKQDITPRSRHFLTLLITMETNGFDYEKTLGATKSTFKKLKQHYHQYSGMLENIEVIPYETLWTWILETLKSRNVRKA